MQQTLLVLSNVPDHDLGLAIARDLVERRLAACVNLIHGVRSVYHWEGAVEEAAEVTLLIKCTAERYDELEAAILAQHPYELPEIVALPLVAGLPAYLRWIESETKKDLHA